MPWTAAGPAHGFSDGEPWLPFVADADGAVRRGAGGRPALDAGADPAARPRCAATSRRCSRARSGRVDAGEHVLAWRRGDEFLAAVNFGTEPALLGLPGTLVLSTDPDRADGPVQELAPAEGVLLRL